ncbi:endothelin-converting enzyme 2-like [Ixodes scapularis]
MAEGEQAAAPAIRTGSIPYRQRDPPTFAGFGSDNVDEWLRTFERVSVHNAWDNTLKLANVVFYLRDTAKVWFDNHEEQIASFKTRLSDVFGCPVSRKENATQRLATRAQSSGESITTYVEDILALCKRVNPTMSEKEKVENIMKGIAEDAFAVLVSRNPTTVAQLQEECQRWEGHRSRRIASPSTVSRLQNCVASSGPPLTGDIKNIIRQIIKEELAVLFTPSRRDLQSEPVDLSPEGIRTLIRNELAQSAPSPQETICAASPAHACGTPSCFQADYNPRFVQSSERPWLRQFSSPPATRRPTFTETDRILVTNVKLLQALDRLCQLSSPEDILRYISWTVVQLLGWMADPTLPSRPQSAATEDSRSVDCFWAIDRVFGLASWSSYITSRFPTPVRADVDRILSSVVQSTVDMLLRSSWIDNATKEVAVHKVRNIQTFLWPPEEFFNATETADLLKPFPDPSDSVISSWLRASIVRRGLLGRAGFESLLDADSDLRSLFRYRYYVNELAVSLTAVSSPLYIQGATSALNYGGLGVHYATTLARAFDHKGVLVDALGRGTLWWSRASYPAYESRSSCRGADGAESTKTDMDGVTALGVAYDAFKVNRALSPRKISDAKFLGMSEDQVFFVGFCQAFCASVPTEQQRSSCDTPLKNSGEFARAFNCPLDSPMNPSVKCSFFDDAGERSRPSASVPTIRTPHPGYSLKNILNFQPQGQDVSVPAYSAYKDVKNCDVLRMTYAGENACALLVPKSKLGHHEVCCDFIFDLLCGTTTKFNISDSSCP